MFVRQVNKSSFLLDAFPPQRTLMANKGIHQERESPGSRGLAGLYCRNIVYERQITGCGAPAAVPVHLRRLNSNEGICCIAIRQETWLCTHKP